MRLRSATFVTLAVVPLVVLTFELAGPGAVAGGDEPEYLAVANSLLQDGNIYLEDDAQIFEPHYLAKGQAGEGYLKRISAPGEEPTFFPKDYIVNVIPGKNGHLLPYHPIGTSLVLLPGMAALGTWGARLTIVFASALLALNIFLVSNSLATATLLLLSPPLIYYAILCFNEIPTALLTLYAYRKISEGLRKRQDGFYVGLAVAFLPWLHPKYLVICGLLGVLLFRKLRKDSSQTIRRGLIIFCLLGISLAALLTFYEVVYGNWRAALATGHPGIINPIRGALGLLVDRDYGVLQSSPLCFLIILGMFLGQKDKKPGWFPKTLGALAFIGSACFGNWHGGASPAGRFLVPAIPVVGSVYLPQFVNSKAGKFVVFLIFLLGMLLAYTNLFRLKNLGFVTPNKQNEALQLLPGGNLLQKTLPILIE